jgi:hypothetical protein
MKATLLILLTTTFSLITNAQKWINYTTASTSTQLCNNTVNAIAGEYSGQIVQ